MVFVMWASSASAADETVMKQLVPTGKLRVGIAYAPSPTPVFVTRDVAGETRGAAKDIGAALAKSLGVPAEFVVTATTGELTDACVNGTIDIGFMPADDERRKRVDFSPNYFVIESTYLAAGPSGIRTIADVDRPEVTVVAINGSTTSRAASRTLKTAKVVNAKSVDEAMEVMKAGGAQAFALTHDSLPALQPKLPGSRILDGAFQTVGVAVAVQKDRPAALAYVSEFVAKAKTDGTVRKAFDDAGLTKAQIAK
jgi:polar amino acid transport system substrate-binding protein